MPLIVIVDENVHVYHMMTSSNGNIFCVTGLLCGEFTGHRWIPLTKAGDAELWCFLWSALNKPLSKQSWGWWFETPSRSLWRHCYDSMKSYWRQEGVWCNIDIPAELILKLPSYQSKWKLALITMWYCCTWCIIKNKTKQNKTKKHYWVTEMFLMMNATSWDMSFKWASYPYPISYQSPLAVCFAENRRFKRFDWVGCADIRGYLLFGHY